MSTRQSPGVEQATCGFIVAALDSAVAARSRCRPRGEPAGERNVGRRLDPLRAVNAMLAGLWPPASCVGAMGETAGGGGGSFFLVCFLVASGNSLHEVPATTPFVTTAPGELKPAVFVGPGCGVHDVETLDAEPDGGWKSDSAWVCHVGSDCNVFFPRFFLVASGNSLRGAC